MIAQALFAALAAILLGSALMVILHKNPVTSALFLVLAFCSLAGIYLTLQAEFLGMVQIIVYAGAIMVLFLFVIMYLNLKHDAEGGVQIAVRRGLGWILGAVMLTEAALFVSKRWAIGPESPPEIMPVAGNTQAIGQLLYSRYLFPFEITSMVLLVAMVGAIVISKSRASMERPKAVAAPPVAGIAPAPTLQTAAPGATPPTAAAPHTPEVQA
jgi:NADH-quinone oxidoreductase subunit J